MGKAVVDVVVIVECQSELLQVILALRTASCLASLLHCWQQQGHKNGDDRNHHQKFDQRKSAMAETF